MDVYARPSFFRGLIHFFPIDPEEQKFTLA